MAKEDEGKGKGKPALFVKDIVFGEPQPLGAGQYEIAALVFLQAGNKPVYGASGQFYVNAAPVGNLQAIVEGKIADTLRVTGKKPTIALEVKSEYFGDKIFPLRNIDLPLPKSEGNPFDFEVKAEGRNGVYQVNMQIVDAEGNGVTGTIRVVTETSKNDYPSEINGSCFQTITLDSSQEVRFFLLGTAKDKTLKLLGPSKSKPQCPATPDNVKGFFSGLRAGWEKRKKRKR